MTNLTDDNSKAQACADAFKPLASAAAKILRERIDDGGPAFPSELVDSTGHQHHDGMSLRDYFAAKAMSGMTNGLIDTGWQVGEHDQAIQYAVEMAYIIAGAMLEPRSR